MFSLFETAFSGGTEKEIFGVLLGRLGEMGILKYAGIPLLFGLLEALWCLEEDKGGVPAARGCSYGEVT